MTKELKIACVSDIHLGHIRNKALDIIQALNLAFPDNVETAELDIIFLAGDIFDRELSLPNNDISDIYVWMERLLTLCGKRDIKLRVLEGTPSHDWKQSKNFETILKVTRIPVDFKYVSTLSIEKIEDLGISVLYMPDEWGITAQDTYDQTLELLKLNELDKVDYGVFHGQFDFQATWENKDISKDTISHDSQKYLDIVKNYIFIGHIHTFSTSSRIIAQGSFDRLSHGQEEPKGHVRAIVTKDSRDFFFIENKLARVYKTITCKDTDLKVTLDYIDKKVKKLPNNSCIRIVADSTHPILSNLNTLIKMYPTIVWTKESKVKKESKKEIVLKTNYSPAITISKDNVSYLLEQRMIKSNYSADKTQLVLKLLHELV